MNPDALDPSIATTTSDEGAPQTLAFGPYRLIHKIGEGGMGEVWLAEQVRPVHRQVAVKIIKVGMDTRQVVARFEAERQALALMDHPAIATVFDGGSTPEGRPYFAMEYVKGEPITTYCDRQRLDTRARLELFILVCEGVQHAHQKGIIHRDLKPSNVLVTLQQDRPVPKIIDFGVAKATTQHLTERTLVTEFGILVGTPEYMSPEQAELTGLDIDTRTDVYALGVLLYELLTGALPFDRSTLVEKGLEEIRRTIREVDPPRPSMRITQMGAASARAAANRHTEPGRLASQLRGDLDWITMKSLEKDRTRRYDTVMGLAADLRRHLGNEPVAAGPPSAVYRGRKFARRHRFGVTAALTLVLLLIAFGSVMAVQASRIARERDRANREARVAQQVSEFLVGMFETTDPFEGRGKDTTVLNVLDRGSRRIGTELRDQPEVRAALMDTMGRVYYALGVYDRASELVEDALGQRIRTFGRDNLDVAASLNNLGAVKIAQGAHREAETMLRESLAIRRRRLGADSAEVAETLNALGSLRESTGDWRGAETVLREALAIHRKVFPADDLRLATTINNVALVLSRLEKFGEGEALYAQSLAIRRKQLGAEHPFVAQSLNNIGMLHVRQKKHAQAEPLFEEALAINRKAVGSVHPVVAANLSNLALVALNTNKLRRAEEYSRQVLEMDTKILGERSTQGNPVSWHRELATRFGGGPRRTDVSAARRSGRVMRRSLTVTAQRGWRSAAAATRRGGSVRRAYEEWRVRGWYADAPLPHFSAIRTSARIHGWMQHWYFSTPASSSCSLDDAPGARKSPAASWLHSGATVVSPMRSFSCGTIPPPNSSTSVKVCVSPPRLVATSSWPTLIATFGGAKCHAPTEP